MRKAVRTLAGAAALAGIAMTGAFAQAPPVPDGPRYVITYVEVIPTAAAEGAALARAMREAMRNEAGNLRSGAVERIGQPNQLVILSAWKDEAALAAHAKAPQTVNILGQLMKIQNAPFDERVTFPLSVGDLHAQLDRNSVVVVSHVDVIPPQREMATALVKQHAEDGRADAGNLRFEALTQTNRQNHFTVVEAWKNRDAAQQHGMNAKTRAFRDKIAPAIGALYDERFYTPLR
jgi:quinol monooxygenase YgiN